MVHLSTTISPSQILETLFPFLQGAAAYAQQIQATINALPSKDSDNPFAAALTSADLSIQTLVEVALLGAFPDIRFYGEEYEQSYNTAYFRSIELGDTDDYLVTLDPIDGTRFYKDGYPNYQIILTILNTDDYEAVIALSPAYGSFDVAFRGQGTLRGQIDQGLVSAVPYQVKRTNLPIFLGTTMGDLAKGLGDRHSIIDVQQDYSTETRIPNVNGILNGELSAVAIRTGKFIDGGALAFLAREAGCIVTGLDGSPLPPVHSCTDHQFSGIVMATSSELHHDILNAIRHR
ncbi:MAG: inositol monophosphatase family protein [Elainellaceae cyanobacterium]